MGKHRSRCPMNHAVEILGDQWTLLVVRDMIFHAKNSFSELSEMPEGIATNILTDRLNRLEASGIIEKRVDSHDARKRNYSLTRHGLGLIPVLLELMVWSRDHTSDVDVTHAVTKKIKRDREAAVVEIRDRLKQASSLARD
ncbi:MAG: helix-turn-helix domain-containing protein [Pseudomonadota bacterium]